MKFKTIILFGFLAAFAQGFASKSFDERIAVREDQKVVIQLEFADDIRVIPVSGDQLRLSGEIEVNDGENDDAYTVEVVSNDKSVSIESDLKKGKDIYRVVEHLDQDGNITYSSHTIEISGHFDIYVPIGRSVSIETINADLRIQDTEGRLAAETINGEIDLSVSSDADFDLKVSTINGECYTDLDLQPIGKGINSLGYGGSDANVRLNGGGRSIELNTINGTMYLRKK